MKPKDRTPKPVLLAIAICVVAGTTALFAYLQAMAHVRYVADNQQPSFHHVYQFREQHLRLMGALRDYIYGSASIDHEMLMERFDVLWSRVAPLTSDEIWPLLGDQDDARNEIERLRAILAEVDLPIQELVAADRASGERILRRIEDLFDPYESTRRNLHRNTDQRNVDLIREARRFGYIQIALLSLSLLAGGVLFFVVFRQGQRASHLASHDPLTGLLNRPQLGPALAQAQRAREDPDVLIALHCIDLDHFKSINDTLGHPVGDALLIEVGRRLKTSVRSTDAIIRLGGDEFAIVQPDLRDLAQAEDLAKRLVQLGSGFFDVDGRELVAGISVGSAVFPKDAADVGNLIEKADLALYKAKQTAHGQASPSGGRASRRLGPPAARGSLSKMRSETFVFETKRFSMKRKKSMIGLRKNGSAKR